MLEIAYLICTLGNPCVEKTVPIQESVTPYQCLLKAQEIVANEVKSLEAGSYRIERISCRRPTKSA